MSFEFKSFGLKVALLIIILSIIVLSYVAYDYFSGRYQSRMSSTILEGKIGASSSKYYMDEPGKIQTGSPVDLKLRIKNVGNKPSVPTTVYIRYVFPKPLDNQPKSLLFETEKVKIAELGPGEEIEIAFKSPHYWPTLFDFVKNDWGLREYQAVVVTSNNNESIIGTMSISFTAYYYVGPTRVIPSKIEF